MTWNAQRAEDTVVPTPEPEPTLEERVAALEAKVGEHAVLILALAETGEKFSRSVLRITQILTAKKPGWFR